VVSYLEFLKIKQTALYSQYCKNYGKIVPEAPDLYFVNALGIPPNSSFIILFIEECIIKAIYADMRLMEGIIKYGVGLESFGHKNQQMARRQEIIKTSDLPPDGF
jgi:hypothetical protein